MKDWLPLIGVVIAQFAILFLFVLKQRADDKRRWNEKRLELYTKYLLTFFEVERELSTRPGNLKQGEKFLIAEFCYIAAQISLVATKPVDDAAEGLMKAVLRNANDVLDAKLAGSDLEVQISWDPLHRAFLAAVRNELNIRD